MPYSAEFQVTTHNFIHSLENLIHLNVGDGHFKLLLNISVLGSYSKKIRKNIYEGRG